MNNPLYPEEFKIQGINQVIEKKLHVADMASRLGVSTHSLYARVKCYSKPQEELQQGDDKQAELRRLKAELKRVTEERDILKWLLRLVIRAAICARQRRPAPVGADKTFMTGGLRRLWLSQNL
jgi:transposase